MISPAIPPDLRLVLPRPDGGSVRVQIVSVALDRFVEMARFDADLQVRSRVRVVPEELDRVIETFALCRGLLLGAPDPRAAVREAQERVGLAARRRGR